MSAAGELILDHVERHARLRPTATAVYEFSPAREQPRELTWAELDAGADRTATALLELGVARAMRSLTSFPIGSNSSQSASRRCGSAPSASR